MEHNKIKEARLSRKLTQQEMADRLGISRRALIALERQELLVNRHLEDISRETGASIPQLTGYAVLEEEATNLNDMRALFMGRESAIEDRHRMELAIKDAQIKAQEEEMKRLRDELAGKDIIILRLQKQLDSCINESHQTEGQDAEND